MSEEKWGVGNRETSSPFASTWIGARDDKGGGHPISLIHGQYPHSRSESLVYARFPDGNIHAFDGHRLLHNVKFHDYNYLKESELTGSEVRKGGLCTIEINGLVCHEFFYRDIMEAMLQARMKISQIHDHPIQIWDPEQRKEIVGRKVYYREFPAVITMLLEDQGCVILKPDDPDRVSFPPMPYDYEDVKEGQAYDPSESGTAKVDLDSPHIWWWRK